MTKEELDHIFKQASDLADILANYVVAETDGPTAAILAVGMIHDTLIKSLNDKFLGELVLLKTILAERTNKKELELIDFMLKKIRSQKEKN